MDVQVVTDPSKSRRDHIRLTIDHKSDMTNERLVENCVNGLTLKMPALWQAFESRLRRVRKLSIHQKTFPTKIRKSPNFSAFGVFRGLYLASIQLLPEPISTSRGTYSSAADSISRLMSSLARSISS